MPQTEIGKLTTLYLPQLIVGAALVEGLTFFLAVTYLLEKNPIGLGITLLLVAALVARFPTRRPDRTLDRRNSRKSSARRSSRLNERHHEGRAADRLPIEDLVMPLTGVAITTAKWARVSTFHYLGTVRETTAVKMLLGVLIALSIRQVSRLRRALARARR